MMLAAGVQFGRISQTESYTPLGSPPRRSASPSWHPGADNGIR